jgi:mono/diheme cytochrome c family protein
MFNRILTTVLLVALLVTLLVQPSFAGGWTVVTLDQLPQDVQAGERVQVGFQVQQHGVHPLVLGPGEAIIIARRQDSGERIEAVAEASGEPGHYTAEILFPTGGVWTWEVRPGGFPPAAMPDLVVAPGIAQPAAQDQPEPGGWGGWRQFLALLQPPPAVAAPSANLKLETDPVAYGKSLFVAKGCVTCHIHGRVAIKFSVAVGPDLTDYKVIPEYVAVWLKDPKSIKPQTAMPQLQLSKSEIDALVAFLSAGQE